MKRLEKKQKVKNEIKVKKNIHCYLLEKYKTLYFHRIPDLNYLNGSFIE